jgi:hypothetical protein
LLYFCQKKRAVIAEIVRREKAVLWLKDMAKIKRDKIMSVIANQ